MDEIFDMGYYTTETRKNQELFEYFFIFVELLSIPPKKKKKTSHFPYFIIKIYIAF